MKNQPYNDDPIKALPARESVRLRPAMYFGSNAEFGLHAMLCEALGFLAFDFFAGKGSRLTVFLNPDGSVTLSSDWTDISPELKNGDWKNRTHLELEMTELYFGRFRSFGRLSVGMAAVNFISERFEIEIHLDGGVFEQKYERGIPSGPVVRLGNSKDRKTRIQFKPDGEVMTMTDFNFGWLVVRLRELACFLPGFTFYAEDLRDGRERKEELRFPNGVTDYVSWLVGGRETILPNPFFIRLTEGEATLEVALQYLVGETGETVFSLANGSLTELGGTHVSVFKSGLMTTHRLRKGTDGSRVVPERLLRGLVAAISVRVPDCDLRFEGALQAQFVTRLSETLIVRLNDEIERFFEGIPGIAKRLRAHFLN